MLFTKLATFCVYSSVSSSSDASNSSDMLRRIFLFKYSENLNNNTAILNRSLLQKTSALSPLMYDDYFNDIHFHDIGDDEFFQPPDDKPKVLL